MLANYRSKWRQNEASKEDFGRKPKNQWFAKEETISRELGNADFDVKKCWKEIVSEDDEDRQKNRR